MSAQKQIEPEPEVLDLSNLKPVSKRRSRVKHKKPKLKLWPWALIGLILISSGLTVGILKSQGTIPRIAPSPPSTTTISTTKTPTPPTTSTTTPTPPSTSGSTPTTTTPTPPPPPPIPNPVGNTVTLLHGRASSTTFVVQTIEFEGNVTMYVAVNYDKTSIDYQTFSVYLPSNTGYGVQMWQNTIPSDTRPMCNVYNGSVSPFMVGGASDQIANFTC